MDRRHDGAVRGETVCAGDSQEVATDDMDIVSRLRSLLADKVGNDRYELFFGADTKLALEDDKLSIGAPNQFFHDWMRANFRRDLESLGGELLGRPVSTVFYVDESPVSSAAETTGDCAPTPASREPASREKKPAAHPSKARRRFASLASFVRGPTNELAASSARMVAERLGAVSPLVLVGPTGVGKTHLLEGIWSAARRAQPLAQTVFLSAEQFTTYFLGALRGSGLPSFRRKYRGVDLLVIDDLQFFAGKRATLVELLHTVDTLLREGRQLVMAADRAPEELTALGPELINRLLGGMVCRIEAPDRAVRLGVVRQLTAKLTIPVPPDVQEFLATHINSHTRQLAGALNLLEATSRAHGRPITLAMAEESLRDMIRAGARAVRLADINRAVCDVFGLEPEALQSKRKAKSVSHPRMLAMWLARKHTRAALSEIGHFFGNRTHTTVISAQKKVGAWMREHGDLALPDRTWKIEEAIRRVEENLKVG